MLIEGDRYTYARPQLAPESPSPTRTDTVQHGDAVERDTPQKKTPAEQTDDACATYQKALQHRDQALRSAPKNAYERQEINDTENSAVSRAKKDLDNAVAAELGGRIAYVNHGVPPEFQTSPDSLITAYGKQILQRHANDPAAASAALSDSIDNYRMERQVDSLIPAFHGNPTPAEKLAQIHSRLTGQPSDVVDRVMTDPRVQQILKDAANWVAEPYKGMSEQQAGWDNVAAADASKRLANLTANLPPEYAQQLVRQTMPTIRTIANLEAQSGNLDSFTNLSRVVDSLGAGADAQALTSQIAQACDNQFQRWEGFFGETIKNAVGKGASPKLALELATQLQASGKADQAKLIVMSVGQGAEALQRQLKQDMQDYSEHTKDLNWLASTAKGKLTPDQMQQAIGEYIGQQGPEWRSKLNDIEGRLTADAESLGYTIGALKTLPGELNGLGADALHGVSGAIGEDKATQAAFEFALSKDPTLIKGKDGEGALTFLTEVGHNNKDLANAIGKAYISTQILPDITGLNQNDLASVKRANVALDKLQANGAKFLGVPQNEIDAGVSKLRQCVGTLRSTKALDETFDTIKALDAVKKDLGEVKDLRFSTGLAGVTFRTLAFGLTGANLINQSQKLFDDPNAPTLDVLQNWAGELAYAAGVAQDSSAFGVTMKLVDPDSATGQFGLAASGLGELTERFIGAMNAVYFGLGAASDIMSQDGVNVPSLAFNLTGATGSVLSILPETVLGAWTGPVGAAMVVVATAGHELVEYREEIDRNTDLAQKFLQGAGVNEATAKTLSREAMKQSSMLQDELGLSPEQMQQIAAKHPEIFQSPGHAGGAIAVADACGIKSDDMPGFLDALAKDDPNYAQRLFDQDQNGKGSAQPLTHEANLYDFVTQQSPTAAAYVRQHSTDKVGHDADLVRQADRAYESAFDTQAQTIASLMSGSADPAFNAEIVRIMSENGSLDHFVQQIATSYHYNGWPESARDAIQDARSAGVLTSDQARSYLNMLA